MIILYWGLSRVDLILEEGSSYCMFSRKTENELTEVFLHIEKNVYIIKRQQNIKMHQFKLTLNLSVRSTLIKAESETLINCFPSLCLHCFGLSSVSWTRKWATLPRAPALMPI